MTPEPLAATDVELDRAATYPEHTAWRVYRDGVEVGLATASGPLSALVCVGREMPTWEPCAGKWEVERVS